MKKFWITLWCILLVLTGIEATAARTMSDVSGSLVRLHVIAANDTEEAQAAKLSVRDRIIETFGEELSRQGEIGAVRDYAGTHLADFKKVAEDELCRLGIDEPVAVSFERTAFNTREYGDLRLPAGYYDALRIVIGEGAGKNWWCVLFPPLCFVEDAKGTLPPESEAILKENMSDESYALLKKDGNLRVEMRFKLVELWESAKIKTAQAWGGK